MATAKKKANPKGDKVKRVLPFKLTDTDKAKRANEAAALAEERDELVIEKKIETDKYAGRIKDKTARIGILLQQIRTGEEEREVECVQVKNFDAKKVEYWYEGEKMSERALEESDKQLSLTEAQKKAKFQKTGTGAVPVEMKKVAGDTPKNTKADAKRLEIAAVHKEETSKKGSYSQLNGPRNA